tara:strand:- start:492 stop:3296 length:2805 start_codon:yes stop_codon:yes gene_type:complete
MANQITLDAARLSIQPSWVGVTVAVTEIDLADAAFGRKPFVGENVLYMFLTQDGIKNPYGLIDADLRKQGPGDRDDRPFVARADVPGEEDVVESTWVCITKLNRQTMKSLKALIGGRGITLVVVMSDHASFATFAHDARQWVSGDAAWADARVDGSTFSKTTFKQVKEPGVDVVFAKVPAVDAWLLAKAAQFAELDEEACPGAGGAHVLIFLAEPATLALTAQEVVDKVASILRCHITVIFNLGVELFSAFGERDSIRYAIPYDKVEFDRDKDAGYEPFREELIPALALKPSKHAHVQLHPLESPLLQRDSKTLDAFEKVVAAISILFTVDTTTDVCDEMIREELNRVRTSYSKNGYTDKDAVKWRHLKWVVATLFGVKLYVDNVHECAIVARGHGGAAARRGKSKQSKMNTRPPVAPTHRCKLCFEHALVEGLSGTTVHDLNHVLVDKSTGVVSLPNPLFKPGWCHGFGGKWPLAEIGPRFVDVHFTQHTPSAGVCNQVVGSKRTLTQLKDDRKMDKVFVFDTDSGVSAHHVDVGPAANRLRVTANGEPHSCADELEQLSAEHMAVCAVCAGDVRYHEAMWFDFEEIAMSPGTASAPNPIMKVNGKPRVPRVAKCSAIACTVEDLARLMPAGARVTRSQTAGLVENPVNSFGVAKLHPRNQYGGGGSMFGGQPPCAIMYGPTPSPGYLRPAADGDLEGVGCVYATLVQLLGARAAKEHFRGASKRNWMSLADLNKDVSHKGMGVKVIHNTLGAARQPQQPLVSYKRGNGARLRRDRKSKRQLAHSVASAGMTAWRLVTTFTGGLFLFQVTTRGNLQHCVGYDAGTKTFVHSNATTVFRVESKESFMNNFAAWADCKTAMAQLPVVVELLSRKRKRVIITPDSDSEDSEEEEEEEIEVIDLTQDSDSEEEIEVIDLTLDSDSEDNTQPYKKVAL